MFEIIGWIGAVMLGISGLPQAWKCMRTHDAKSLSWGLLFLWIVGEVLCLIATLATLGVVYWLLFNYMANIIAISIIIYYKRVS